ncbi:MAG: AIR synthase-related protein, partial [Anaerolineae bacterium]
ATLCATFGLNPLGLIASGSLLIALPPEETPALLAAYEKAHVPCAVIGRITSAEEGLKLKSGATITDLPRFDQDELTKLF